MKQTIVVPAFETAKITTGIYQTSSYFKKEYRSKSGLISGLKSIGFKGDAVADGDTFHGYNNKTYTVRLYDF